MKRSEMVEILENEINSRQYQDYQFDTEIVSEILTALEKAGMLPPHIPTNASGWEISKGMAAYIHEWEPEDD